MFRTLLSLALVASTTLPALAHPDRHEDKDRRKEWKQEQKEDRKYWKEQEKHERKYWKEREKEGREYRAHRYENEDRDHDRGRRHAAPPWMNSYWRSGEERRYVAMVPGDPSRIYVFLDGRWVLRQVRDPRARLDLEGAFRLPMAPPPIPPPRIGLNLHVVLFN